jgi:hypothetical protein
VRIINHARDTTTVFPNVLLRDQRLSHMARGVICEMFSYPDEVKIAAEDLWRVAAEHRPDLQNTESLAAYEAAFQELILAGHLHVVPDDYEPERPEREPAEAGNAASGTPKPKPSSASWVPVPHAVYRYYDADDVLLYVGISKQLAVRERTHIQNAVWMKYATRSAITRYPSKLEARRAEVSAIKNEHPVFNVAGNNTPEAQERRREYRRTHPTKAA